VIFRDKKSDSHGLGQKISNAIKDSYSFEVPVIVNELDELRHIISANPFLADNTKNVDYLHVTFLEKVAANDLIEKIIDINYQPDEFIIIGEVVYLYCPNGYSKSKLTNAFFESKLKVTATTRNWRTTLELLNLAQKARSKSLLL